MDCNTSSSSSSHSSSLFPPNKEHMFDKVVTPSDVGKLNRLVIPKQHAQKYFPLERTTWNVLDQDSSSDKGLLLNFEEDRTDGKIWRFRYSYWSSSQSYVITRGWSRFVKDKKLNSGDVISFYRAKDRLFIDWRYQIHHLHHQQRHFYWSAAPAAAGPLFSPNLYYFNLPSNSNIMAMDHLSFLGRPPLTVAGGGPYEPSADQGMNVRSEAQQQRNSGIMISTGRAADNDDEEGETEEETAAAAPVHKAGEMKQLRLFGVNMKCGAPPHPAGS